METIAVLIAAAILALAADVAAARLGDKQDFDESVRIEREIWRERIVESEVKR